MGGKSQFFKLFKRYETGSFRFEFQYTETMKKVSALISDYVCIPSRLGEGVKRAAKEKFIYGAKKCAYTRRRYSVRIAWQPLFG